MLREGSYIAHMVDETVCPVLRDVGTRIRHQGHASACHGLGTYKAKALLDAWQGKEIGIAHQFRNVLAMSQNLHAWMSKHGLKFSAIGGDEVSSNEKPPGF